VNNGNFTGALLAWYAQHARNLPWRGNHDPYTIWVSEIMLQQTRVESVIPYFRIWLERFPDIPALARASQQEVLALWEGLGYYSRARNMHRAAQIIMKEWNGELPQDPQALSKLPGIGRYTAGAIASIGFGKDAPALDGNIRRVMARLFDITEPVSTLDGKKRLWELVAANLPSGKAGEYNQALMDLGATICTPRAPDCLRCPLAEMCLAFAAGVQEERPVRPARAPIPHYLVTAAVIQRNQQFLIAQRPDNGLLGGLWEYPGGKLQPDEDLASCLRREICEELGVEVIVVKSVGVYKHAYTHFRVTLHAYRCQLPSGAVPKPVQAQALRWVKLAELAEYPMGKIDRQISRDLQRLEAAC
jgi:A/G-specific adenine glycosylase